jgi:hypothetical protein
MNHYEAFHLQELTSWANFELIMHYPAGRTSMHQKYKSLEGFPLDSSKAFGNWQITTRYS